MTDKPKYTNALIDSESPYLLQHAHNPVNWQPWSDQTWERAVAENKPVIVSIGYSTCHWCHVMEHESFEDEETAEAMNVDFISIKVDREERPDVDLVYMDACQLMTGRGGWPLNAICMPDKRPVFAGTYFPRDAWKNILSQIAVLWKNEPEKLSEHAKKIEEGLTKMNLLEFPAKEKFTRMDLGQMADKLVQSFDLEHGGLDRGQKFPMPVVYEYLLDEYLISGNKHLLDFVNFTLLKMANGGIYDHLRGGFYRYATDRLWFAPHFEKMLYDNSQLISLYARAYAITGADLYKDIALESRAFCNRELKMPGGGYFSALDADSEGIEGRFYVFTYEEMKSTLTPEELQFAEIVFGLKEGGNWEHKFNILFKPLSPLQILEATQLDVHTYRKMYHAVQEKLFALQETRIRPSLDNKIICSWNGLMLKALADLARYTDEDDSLKQAQELAKWLLENLISDGKLLRVHTKTSSRINAFSEDYACLISGLIALFEADGNAHWLERSVNLADAVLKDYYDHERSLFVFTPLSEDPLILHKTDTSDDVIPSSNSMLAIAFQKLGVLMNRNDLVEIGKQLLPGLRSHVAVNPPWYANWARVAQIEAVGLLQVFSSGITNKSFIKAADKKVPAWYISGSDKSMNLPVMEHKINVGEQRIYICLDSHCMEPVNSGEAAFEILEDVLHDQGR